MEFIEAFHFLRPWWLLAVPVFLIVIWANSHLTNRHDWHRFIAPQLLRAMLVKQEASSVMGPALFGVLQMVFWVIALAGPSWERVEHPYFSRAAPLVIALELHENMLEADLKPNRLAHARLKIADLLQRRKGAETALIVYAGSAHTVVPLTEDREVHHLFLNDLSPALMPVPGMNLESAYSLAQGLLGDRATEGNVLFIGSGETGDQWPLITASAQFRATYWQFSARREWIPEAQRMTADDKDINTIERMVSPHISAEDGGYRQQHWKDAGYYFVFPAAFFVLLFFRRGVALQWR